MLAVSREWSASVRSMPSIGAAVTWKRVSARMIGASPLALHVKHFGLADAPGKISCGDLLFLSRPPISLISLACAVDLSPSAAGLSLGASLQSLTLRLDDEANTAPSINDAIVTISRLPLLETLVLHLPSYFPEVSFAPLAVAPKLQDLRFWDVSNGVEPSLSQLDELRMLPRRRKMEVELSRDSILHLLRTPHALQWQQIQRVDGVDEEVASALSTLPSLTHLIAFNCRSVAFFSVLTRLRSLHLHVHPAARLAADIAAGLPRCSQLTELTLSTADVTSQHLSRLLPRLPLLRSLELMFCSALDSLSFLSECSHLAQSLHSLSLRGTVHPVVHSTEIKHVLTLKSLTQLGIYFVFVEPLDAPMVQSLTPPSVVLPKLIQFDYFK